MPFLKTWWFIKPPLKKNGEKGLPGYEKTCNKKPIWKQTCGTKMPCMIFQPSPA